MHEILFIAGLVTLGLSPFILIAMLGGFERSIAMGGHRPRSGCHRATYGEWPSYLVKRDGKWFDTRTNEFVKTMNFGELMATYGERK
jgi:hypothetical protein